MSGRNYTFYVLKSTDNDDRVDRESRRRGPGVDRGHMPEIMPSECLGLYSSSYSVVSMLASNPFQSLLFFLDVCVT